MPPIAPFASVVQPLGRHTWWNTAHGAVLGGLFLALTLVTLLLVLQTRPRDLTPAGARVSLTWARAACVGMLVLGWAAVLTGSFAVDHWFIASVPTSPASLLRARGDGAWVTAERVKEAVAWVSVLCATAGAVLILRRGPWLLRRGRARVAATAALAVATGLAGVAGILGVLLTKLAPLL